jgi:hypothetical protein
MTLSTSAVAVCRWSASLNWCRRRLISVFLIPVERRRLRATFDGARRFALIACCEVAGLRLLALRRFTEPSLSRLPQPSTLATPLCSTANWRSGL